MTVFFFKEKGGNLRIFVKKFEINDYFYYMYWMHEILKDYEKRVINASKAVFGSVSFWSSESGQWNIYMLTS